MYLHTELHEKTATVFVRGNMEIASAAQVRESIESLISQRVYHVTLDLTDAAHVDSSGMAELILCYLRLRKLGGTLFIQNAPDQMRSTFFATRLLPDDCFRTDLLLTTDSIGT